MAIPTRQSSTPPAFQVFTITTLSPIWYPGQVQSGRSQGDQNTRDKPVGERAWHRLAGDQDPVVHRTDERVQHVVDVGAGGQLAALDRAQQWQPVAVALLAEVLVAEPRRQLRIVLRLPGEGPEHRPRVAAG